MSARIKFEDIYGKALGYVELKGKKLVGSNEHMKAMAENWTDPEMNAGTPESFISKYSGSEQRSSFLYSKLVDSDDDDTEYPED